LLGNACTITEPTRGSELAICTLIATATDGALIPFIGECAAGLAAFNLYCGAVHTGPVDGADGLTAADFVCDAMTSIESALPDPDDTLYEWYANVSVDGALKQTPRISSCQCGVESVVPEISGAQRRR
jgi:hypothetical protein